MPEAREAIEFFCYSAKKSIAALAAVLGGIDRLVFTGGIGANSPEVRSGICAGLEFLGVVIDHGRNLSGGGVISHQRSPVTIQALKCDEQLVMAGQMLQLLQPAPPTAKV
jgi:acetate kinase